MDLVDALTRVLELARRAYVTHSTSLNQVRLDEAACNLVEDYMVKHLGSNPINPDAPPYQ